MGKRQRRGKMTEKHTKICDRCGKEEVGEAGWIGWIHYPGFFEIIASGKPHSIKYDLCQDCRNSLNDWVRKVRG
jgi:hypothetical protein